MEQLLCSSRVQTDFWKLSNFSLNVTPMSTNQRLFNYVSLLSSNWSSSLYYYIASCLYAYFLFICFWYIYIYIYIVVAVIIVVIIVVVVLIIFLQRIMEQLLCSSRVQTDFWKLSNFSLNVTQMSTNQRLLNCIFFIVF